MNINDNAVGNDTSYPGNRKTRGGWPLKLSLAGAGLTAGAVLAGGMAANAATTPNPTATSVTTATAAAASGLSMTGTVTAVGASSVDIKDAAGTVTTYQVPSTADIDKSGEASLSSLAVGDVVTFSTTNGAIDKLHTGTESLNKGGGHGGHGGKLSMSGTVTAVGASSVDIKDAAGTVTTYQVPSTADIDKSGEASLSSLTVGDAVTFSATNGAIDKLHTGTESLNSPGTPATTASAAPAA